MLRELISNEWFTILIVLCICILTLVKTSFSTRFNSFLGIISNSSYFKIYSRDQKLINKFEGFLFINLITSSAVFYFLGYNILFEPMSFDIIFFLNISIWIGAILIIKVVLERIIGSIFEIDKLIKTYIFQKLIYKNYIGLLLLLINILLIFVIQPTKAIIYTVLGFLFIINLIGFVAVVNIYQKTILDNMFYFILYLCALEIAPYIVFYKVFELT